MKTNLIPVIVFSLFLFNSCKKGGNGPDPVPPAIIKPDTLGAGWAKIVMDTTEFYGDIFFINNSNGFLVGNKVYKSVDGGITWAVLSNTKDLINIAATSNGNAFFTKSVSDSVYKYVNGGTALTVLSVGAGGGIHGKDVFFTDNNNGYYIATGAIYNTADAGASWTKLNTTGLIFSPDYLGSYFSNVNTGWIVSSNGIFKTNGTTANWTKAGFTGVLPAVGAAFISVFATANNSVYSINYAGQLYKSTDGGTSFSQIKVFPKISGFTYCDIHFTDNNTGYICVENRIYKTTDAGSSWTVVAALGEAIFLELHFTDATHGWACGSKGTILKLN